MGQLGALDNVRTAHSCAIGVSLISNTTAGRWCRIVAQARTRIPIVGSGAVVVSDATRATSQQPSRRQNADYHFHCIPLGLLTRIRTLAPHGGLAHHGPLLRVPGLAVDHNAAIRSVRCRTPGAAREGNISPSTYIYLAACG